jgi:phage terminase large subunit-like protein
MLAELRNEIRGLKAVTPSDSKGDRLVLHPDKFEAGEVWLPPEVVCPQIAELEDELVFFPNGDFDDFVDIVTQALDELDKPMAGYWDNLAKLAEQMNVRR